MLLFDDNIFDRAVYGPRAFSFLFLSLRKPSLKMARVVRRSGWVAN